MWEKEILDGIVYGDGTILLFSDAYTFKAALLRPGETSWTLFKGNFRSEYGKSSVVYHGGMIMVRANGIYWHALGTNRNDDFAVLVPRPREDDDDGYFYRHGYALQTRGELLWLSVEIDRDYQPEHYCSIASALRISVLALQEANSEGPEKLRWVRKDCRSLADRVLFLGWPNSFAMDALPAPRLGDDGGCAYFVYKDNYDDGLPGEQSGVFRYNLIDETTEFVEWLPQDWENEPSLPTWFLHQPTIAAPIQVPYTYITNKTAPLPHILCSFLHFINN
jgi:hypothetical protein